MNKKGKEKGLFLLLGLFIAILVLFLNQTGLFERLELMTVDLRFKVNGKKLYRGNDVVLVAIRPEDIQVLGKFPWPRSYYAQVIDRLHAAGAKVICFDIFFSFPRSPAGDRALVEATRRAGNVLYPVFYPQGLTAKMFRDGPAVVPKLTGNIPALAGAAAGQGHINLKVDLDGKIRSVPFALSFKGKIFPATGLLSVLKYKDISWKDVREKDNFLYAGAGKYLSPGPDG